ncbi:MAG: nuclear transport factor 2 family protein [Pseudorhodoplanes sp.]
MAKNTLWTPEEDAALARAVEDNVSPLRLAARLQRSLNSVKRRLRELGLTKDNPKPGVIDPLIQVRRWMTMAKAGDLTALVGMYSENASLECGCAGQVAYVGSTAIREYWSPKLRSPAPLAFSLIKATRDNARVVVEYLGYEAKPITMIVTFDATGKIARSECAPAGRTQSAA